MRVHIPTNAQPETGKEENTRASRTSRSLGNERNIPPTICAPPKQRTAPNLLKYVTRPGRATNSIFLGSGGGTQTTWSHLVDSNGATRSPRNMQFFFTKAFVIVLFFIEHGGGMPLQRIVRANVQTASDCIVSLLAFPVCPNQRSLRHLNV